MTSRFAIITFTDGSGGGSIDPTVPDNTLPGSQPGADNTLPGGGHASGQPIVPGKQFIVRSAFGLIEVDKWVACTGLILVPDQSLPPTPEPK